LGVYYKRGSNIRDLAGLFVSLFYVFIGGMIWYWGLIGTAC
jgi:hypothetical protein